MIPAAPTTLETTGAPPALLAPLAPVSVALKLVSHTPLSYHPEKNEAISRAALIEPITCSASPTRTTTPSAELAAPRPYITLPPAMPLEPNITIGRIFYFTNSQTTFAQPRSRRSLYEYWVLARLRCINTKTKHTTYTRPHDPPRHNHQAAHPRRLGKSNADMETNPPRSPSPRKLFDPGTKPRTRAFLSITPLQPQGTV